MDKQRENTQDQSTAQAAAGYYQKAILLKQQKRYDEAIEHFQKAIENNPKNLSYTIDLAICYLNMNNFTHAVNILGPLYQKEPHELLIIKPYCSALLESGNIDKAKQILQTVEKHFTTDLALKALWLKATGTRFPTK